MCFLFPFFFFFYILWFPWQPIQTSSGPKIHGCYKTFQGTVLQKFCENYLQLLGSKCLFQFSPFQVNGKYKLP